MKKRPLTVLAMSIFHLFAVIFFTLTYFKKPSPHLHISYQGIVLILLYAVPLFGLFLGKTWGWWTATIFNLWQLYYLSGMKVGPGLIKFGLIALFASFLLILLFHRSTREFLQMKTSRVRSALLALPIAFIAHFIFNFIDNWIIKFLLSISKYSN